MTIKTKIILFGTGSATAKALEIIDPDKTEILLFLDNDQSKHGMHLYGIPVSDPSVISKCIYDYVVIASMFVDEITNQLAKLGVDNRRIVDLWNVEKQVPTTKSMIEELYHHNIKYKSIIRDEYLRRYFRHYAICDMALGDNRNREFCDFQDCSIKGLDYVRISSLELIAREVHERQIEGAVAELGVYKGHFAKAINHYFSDRTFYLFDTFEGFTDEDAELERQHGYSKAKGGHWGDTNEAIVLAKMEYPDKCIINAARFPDSSAFPIDQRFAFVSIDVDLYKPTYDGLNYFYDRLSKNGFILVHDYNYPVYSGVKKAVRQFSTQRAVSYFPLSDYFGSAVFVK